MNRDDILRALVKPPQWQDGGVYSGSAAWLSFNEKGRFCYGVDLGGIFYMQTPDGEQEGFPTLAAAQAAAEADYRARIGAALDLEKVEKLMEAAEKLAQTMADMLDARDVIRNLSALGYDSLWGEVNTFRHAASAFRGQP